MKHTGHTQTVTLQGAGAAFPDLHQPVYVVPVQTLLRLPQTQLLLCDGSFLHGGPLLCLLFHRPTHQQARVQLCRQNTNYPSYFPSPPGSQACLSPTGDDGRAALSGGGGAAVGRMRPWGIRSFCDLLLMANASFSFATLPKVCSSSQPGQPGAPPPHLSGPCVVLFLRSIEIPLSPGCGLLSLHVSIFV